MSVRPSTATFDEALSGDGAAPSCGLALSAANINPQTGLATDYLNRFNEAVMLLDMIPDLPECAEDFLSWQPASYRDHFLASNFQGRDLAIAAYDAADPALRGEFDGVVDRLTAILVAVADAMRRVRHDDSRIALARQASDWVKPLLMHAASLINGAPPAADVDLIMRQ